MKRLGPLLTLAAVFVLGGGLFLLNATGRIGGTPAAVAEAPAAQAGPAPAAPPATAPTTDASAAPAPAAAAPTEKAYAGRSSGDEVTVAVAVKDGRAVGYVCDGKKIEAWLEGTVEGDKVTLKSSSGKTTVDGTISDTAAFGTVAVAGKSWPYAAQAVVAPGGLYEGRANVNGVAKRIGWIVEKDGKVTGLTQVAGTDEPEPAPAFDPAAPAGVQLEGVPVTVTTVAGDAKVVGS
jgi:hypothetical protein